MASPQLLFVVQVKVLSEETKTKLQIKVKLIDISVQIGKIS